MKILDRVRAWWRRTGEELEDYNRDIITREASDHWWWSPAKHEPDDVIFLTEKQVRGLERLPEPWNEKRDLLWETDAYWSVPGRLHRPPEYQ